MNLDNDPEIVARSGLAWEKNHEETHISNNICPTWEKILENPVFTFILIFFVALFLRLYSLDSTGLTADETFTLFIIEKGGFLKIAEAMKDDFHPPLHYLAIAPFYRESPYFFSPLSNFYKSSKENVYQDDGLSSIRGNNHQNTSGIDGNLSHFPRSDEKYSFFSLSDEFFLRLPGAVAGAFIPAIIPTLSKYFQLRGGLIAGFLAAFSPFQLWISREARMYSWLVLFGALTLLSYLKYKEKPEKKWGYALGLFTALSLYTHYFGFLLPFLLAVYELFPKILEISRIKQTAKKRREKTEKATKEEKSVKHLQKSGVFSKILLFLRTLPKIVKYMAGGFILFCPWLPIVLIQFSHKWPSWRPPLDPIEIFQALGQYHLGPWPQGPNFFELLFPFLFIFYGMKMALKSKNYLPAILAVGPPILGFLIALKTNTFTPRYTACCAFLIPMLMAHGAISFPQKNRYLMVSALFISLIPQFFAHYNNLGEPWKNAGNALKILEKPRQIVLVSIPDRYIPVKFYYNGPIYGIKPDNYDQFIEKSKDRPVWLILSQLRALGKDRHYFDKVPIKEKYTLPDLELILVDKKTLTFDNNSGE